MIRLTVEQLNALRDSIQAGGQVHCAVLPLKATYAHNTIIAWAKGRSEGDEFYLSIWRDSKSLERAKEDEESGKNPPYDFINDPQSLDYSHVYPAGETGRIQTAVPNESAPPKEILLQASFDATSFQYGVHRYLGNAGTAVK